MRWSWGGVRERNWKIASSPLLQGGVTCSVAARFYVQAGIPTGLADYSSDRSAEAPLGQIEWSDRYDRQ